MEDMEDCSTEIQPEPDTRQRLLEAAERVTLREGVSKMTLDAVCAEAEVSKGGLFYHFSSKNELISGMVTRLVERFEQDIGESFEEGMAGSWVSAYARAASPLSGEQQELSVTASLMAAMANDPDLAEPLRERYGSWQAEHVEQDGLDPAFATLMRLAIDGLWLTKLFGLASPYGEFRDEVLEEALRLIREAGDRGEGSEESR